LKLLLLLLLLLLLDFSQKFCFLNIPLVTLRLDLGLKLLQLLALKLPFLYL
jgi:hypothetical protein